MKNTAGPVDIDRYTTAGGLQGEKVPIGLQIGSHDREITVSTACTRYDLTDPAEDSAHFLPGSGGGYDLQAQVCLPFFFFFKRSFGITEKMLLQMGMDRAVFVAGQILEKVDVFSPVKLFF